MTDRIRAADPAEPAHPADVGCRGTSHHVPLAGSRSAVVSVAIGDRNGQGRRGETRPLSGSCEPQPDSIIRHGTPSAPRLLERGTRGVGFVHRKGLRHGPSPLHAQGPGPGLPGRDPAAARGPGGESRGDRPGVRPGHGTMTVEYDPEATDPAALARRVTERAGMRAEPLESPRSSRTPAWWARHGRWAATMASGLALAVGVVIVLGGRAGGDRAGRLSPGDRGGRGRAGPEGGPRPAAAPARHPRADGPGGRWGPWPWGSGTRRRRWPSCSGCPRRSRP